MQEEKEGVLEDVDGVRGDPAVIEGEETPILPEPCIRRCVL
jgi:hypothetical protein